jgi:hypothetical protein
MKTFWKVAAATVALVVMMAGSLIIPKDVEAGCTYVAGKKYCTAAIGSGGMLNGNDWDVEFSFSLADQFASIETNTPINILLTYQGISNATFQTGDMMTFGMIYNPDNRSSFGSVFSAITEGAGVVTLSNSLFKVTSIDTFGGFNTGGTFDALLNLGSFAQQTRVQMLRSPNGGGGEPPAAVPEPSTLLLLSGGFAALAGFGLRRRRQANES